MTIRKLLFFVLFVVAIATLVRQYRAPPPPPEKVVLLDVWYCPVHTDLEYNKPGKCKLCGEELVQKERKE